MAHEGSSNVLPCGLTSIEPTSVKTVGCVTALMKVVWWEKKKMEAAKGGLESEKMMVSVPGRHV